MIRVNGQDQWTQAASQAALLTAAENSAKTYAKNYASYNRAGDVSSLTLADADIEFGYTDASGSYTPLPTYTGYPNTVKVVLRRDNTANGPLGLFFARVLGMDNVNLKATAAATIYAGNVNSFQTTRATMDRILPMTYDVNNWNNFIKTGLGPDGGTPTLDANGVPVLPVYPSIKFVGNFGELSLDQANNGSSAISNWIDYGVSTSSLQQDINAGLLPLSAHNPNSAPDWNGNPGLKTSTIHTTDNHVGQVYLMPLFKPVNDGSTDPSTYQAGNGSGSNYYYTIVQFVAVKIYSAGDALIVVQPSPEIDPNALMTGVAPAAPPSGSRPTLPTTFTGAKLTQ
jgi:hypothetical protein